jgi:colanic acid/amylovoran biosynthesis protein
VIGGCEFFIGSRMHACIAAISQCVPAVAVAYSEKFIGVMETAAIPSVVADARKLNIEEMLTYIGAQYDNREKLREHLDQAIPHVTQAVLHTFADDGLPAAKALDWNLPVAAEKI